MCFGSREMEYQVEVSNHLVAMKELNERDYEIHDSMIFPASRRALIYAPVIV